jgi:acyl-coenzyme A thioesterase PaaI-like protein
MLQYEFDSDTAVEATGDGRFRACVHERWNVGPIANGGYAMAMGMRALGRVLDAADPLTVTAHFLRPTVPGPIQVETEVVKRGRRLATGTARLLQQGREVVRLLGTYGDLSEQSGPTRMTAAPPAFIESSEAVSRPDAPAIAGRYEHRFDPASVPWISGGSADAAEIRGSVRFSDRRPPDVLSLAAIADSFPPPAFAWIEPTWLPTLELTLHVRARPRGEWLRAAFRTRFLLEGLLEEDGEIWDETGRLVALSRQLAMVPSTAHLEKLEQRLASAG